MQAKVIVQWGGAISSVAIVTCRCTVVVPLVIASTSVAKVVIVVEWVVHLGLRDRHKTENDCDDDSFHDFPHNCWLTYY